MCYLSGCAILGNDLEESIGNAFFPRFYKQINLKIFRVSFNENNALLEKYSNMAFKFTKTNNEISELKNYFNNLANTLDDIRTINYSYYKKNRIFLTKEQLCKSILLKDFWGSDFLYFIDKQNKYFVIASMGPNKKFDSNLNVDFFDNINSGLLVIYKDDIYAKFKYIEESRKKHKEIDERLELLKAFGGN